jgi:hypothetical protein
MPTEDATGLSIADWRLIQKGMVAKYASGVPRLGILPSHTSAIVTGTAGLAYSVAAHHAVTSRTGTGVEHVANDGPVSVATIAAPGSNSRIDVIWERPRFPLYSDAGQTTPIFGVTQGTAALTPTKPSIPDGALELATAVFTSSDVATSTTVITQTCPYTAAEGGVVLVRNQTELDAWAPHDGSAAYRLDTHDSYFRVAGAWAYAASGLITTFTPTWVNFTLGASTNTGWWHRSGPFIEGEVHVTLGSGWNFTAAPRLVPPVAIVTPADSIIGQVNMVDNGTGYYLGSVVRSGSNMAPLYTNISTGRGGDISNTTPFSWTSVTTPDSIHIAFRYRAA